MHTHTNTLFYTFLFFVLYLEDHSMSHIKSCLILLVAIQHSILGLSPTDGYLETFQYFMLQS